jgi:hypothetical protein
MSAVALRGWVQSYQRGCCCRIAQEEAAAAHAAFVGHQAQQALLGSSWLQDTAGKAGREVMQKKSFKQMLRTLKNWPESGFEIELASMPKQVASTIMRTAVLARDKICP